MPGKGGGFNTLYESRGNNLTTSTRNELKVTGAQKWGAEGYKDEKPTQPEKPKFLNTTSVSNTSEGNVNQVISTNKNSPYVSVSGGSSSNYTSSSSSTYVPKKQEEKYDPNLKEKKKLMGQLFGTGDDSSSNTVPSGKSNLFEGKSSGNSGGGLFSGMNVTGGSNTITTNQSGNVNNDLLGLGISENTQPQVQQQTNSLDLLNDIFGGGSNVKTNTNTNLNTNTNTNPMNLFGGLTTNNPAPSNTNNNNDIFASLSGGNTSNIFNNNNLKSQYTPYQINTDQFGEMWEKFADEDSYDLNINVASPQGFHEIIKSKGNFAAVEIINNEAISSATYKGQPALVYATIEPNHLGLLVKCQNKNLNAEVGKFVMSLFQ
jgi:hypothetical protein